MNWNTISSEEILEKIKEESYNKKILIFKHSTRCAISSMALGRLERSWEKDNDNIKPYFLDLISHRGISNKIADEFKVRHESPQILLVDKGECVYDASHMGISYSSLQNI